MQVILDYLYLNKEWIFSGAGIFLLSGAIFLLRSVLVRVWAAATEGESTKEEERGGSDPGSTDATRHWQGVLPPESRYNITSRKATGIPAGLQSFSFEYAPRGHAYPLQLQDATVRAEIQFSCKLRDPYRALFAANEYALNVLKPKFLSGARGILEQYWLEELRRGRQEVEQEVQAELSPQFDDLGFSLESVTLGSLEAVDYSTA